MFPCFSAGGNASDRALLQFVGLHGVRNTNRTGPVPARELTCPSIEVGDYAHFIWNASELLSKLRGRRDFGSLDSCLLIAPLVVSLPFDLSRCRMVCVHPRTVTSSFLLATWSRICAVVITQEDEVLFNSINKWSGTQLRLSLIDAKTTMQVRCGALKLAERSKSRQYLAHMSWHWCRRCQLFCRHSSHVLVICCLRLVSFPDDTTSCRLTRVPHETLRTSFDGFLCLLQWQR